MKNWTKDWMQRNNNGYIPMELETAWGRTALLSRNHERTDLEAILFIPGFRTCGLFWDLNGNLSSLYDNYRIYLLDVLGQPGLSHWEAPRIRSIDFGLWLTEVIESLGLESVNVAGVSFGGFLIFKLAEVNNALIKRAFICNPVGPQSIRYNWTTLWYNALPYIKRNKDSLNTFLDKVIINDPKLLQGKQREALLEFSYNSIRYDKVKHQYPYKYDDEELRALKADTYLILDKEDRFIDQVSTRKRLEQQLPNIKGICQITNIGHGLELAESPIRYMLEVMEAK